MANNRDSSKKKPIGDKQNGSSKRVIGKGMTSLDSTQAPLKSETGEPDYEAMTGKGKSKKDKSK